jgi:hypothetical protein
MRGFLLDEHAPSGLHHPNVVRGIVDDVSFRLRSPRCPCCFPISLPEYAVALRLDIVAWDTALG